jgi:hypothetical protein
VPEAYGGQGAPLQEHSGDEAASAKLEPPNKEAEGETKAEIAPLAEENQEAKEDAKNAKE